MGTGLSVSVKDWLLKKLGGAQERAPSVFDAEVYELMGEIHVRELAFWSCVNLIAKALGKCEFKTFLSGEEIKGDEYYLWNYSPNKNQSSSVFLMKLIAMLYRNNEVLVIEDGQQLLVADSFIRKEYVKYDDVFSQVQVGDYSYTRSFTQSEVLYFQLGHCNMRGVLNSLYTSYSKLIAYGMKSYQKSRGSRGILDIETMASNAPDFKETFEKLMNERFKTFFNAENAVLPLFNGYKYTEIGSKTYSNEGTRDIRAMVDDIFDFTALGFQIPPALVSGKVAGTKDAVEQLLTFCIDPLKELLQEEINRKRYGKNAIAEGSFLQIDTKAVKHVDLLSVATAVDKLISSGAFTINDIHEVVGEPKLKESWADRHFMTKNYETVEELLKRLDDVSGGNGGDNNA